MHDDSDDFGDAASPLDVLEKLRMEHAGDDSGGGGGGDDDDDDDPEESYPELDNLEEAEEGGVIKPMGISKRTKRLKRRIPMRTCVASVGLLLAGVVLLVLALDFYFANPDHDGAVPVLILAVLALVPGIYSSFNLYGVLRGWRGYRVDSIPSYEKL